MVKTIISLVLWSIISVILYRHGITDWELLFVMFQIGITIGTMKFIEFFID